MRTDKNKKLLLNLLEQNKSRDFLISQRKLLESNAFINSSESLANSLNVLSSENYIDVICTDRHGEPYYLIQILPKGKSYLTQKKALKRDLILKLSIAFASAIVTFLLGKLLYLIFS